MNLLVDIGNTESKFGYFVKDNFVLLGRLFNECISEGTLLPLFKNAPEFERIFVSSVAPKVTKKIDDILYKQYKKPLELVSVNDNHLVKINIDNKDELGLDLLCDIVGGYHYYGESTVIVDFGTATKILFIDKDGVFSSCSIFLGLSKSKAALTSSTELIPEITKFEVKPISECHNTVDVINSSSYYSQLFTVRGIIDKYEKEVGYSLKKVITGGNAVMFKDEFKEDIYDKYLLFKGLALLTK